MQVLSKLLTNYNPLLIPNYFFLTASLLFGHSRILLCVLLPIYVLFSDFSKILTSTDQHSAQIKIFWEKEDYLLSIASSLHSGDGKTQLPTF